jgi:hypothetical protein
VRFRTASKRLWHEHWTARRSRKKRSNRRPPGGAAERSFLLALARQSRCVKGFDATGRPEGWRHHLPRALGRASQVLPSRSGLSQGNVLSHSTRHSPSPITQQRGLLRDTLAKPTTFVRDSQRRAVKKPVRHLVLTLVQLFDHTAVSAAVRCSRLIFIAHPFSGRLNTLAGGPVFESTLSQPLASLVRERILCYKKQCAGAMRPYMLSLPCHQ